MKRPQGFDAPPVQRRPEPRPRVDDEPVAAAVAIDDRPLPDALPEAPHEDAAPRDGLSARARVRQAVRARKRFERAEAKRFTVLSRRRRRNRLIVLGAFLGMVAIVGAVAFSPITALRVIRVEGAVRVQATDVVEALSSQLGTPLALIDSAAVGRALSTFTLVQTYTTEAHPPDTLVVRIVERDPIGAEKTASGYDLVDSAGVVISSGPDRPEGFPLLDAPSDRARQAAGEVVRSLPADIRAQLDSVRAETHDDVTLTLVSGPEVVWGSADDSQLKAIVLARLLGVAPGATRYDVSAPENPVYS